MNKQKLKESFNSAKNEAKERVDQSTTPPFWKKVRNIAGTVFLVGTSILGVGLPPATPIIIAQWLPVVVALSGGLSGAASLTKRGNARDLLDAIKHLNGKDRAIIKNEVNKQIKSF